MKLTTGKKAKMIAALLVTAVAIAAAVSVSLSKRGTGDLVVYTADAYVKETAMLLQGFHKQTGVPVAPPRGGGSYADAREIGGGAPADILISVALNAYDRNYLAERYSGWAIAFASDQMVIAYSNATLNNSRAADVVNALQTAASSNSSNLFQNAFSELTSGEVKIGISNPESDPAGLRAYLLLYIAGYLYAGNTTYFAQRANASGSIVSSPSAAELVSPLEFGSIQFLFIYKSAAISDHLKYIQLPAELSQGDPALASFYSMFTYSLPGGTVRGSPIFLYVSVMGNISLTGEAYSFLSYLLNNTGMLSSFGLLPLATPLLFANYTNSRIMALLGQGRIAEGGTL